MPDTMQEVQFRFWFMCQCMQDHGSEWSKAGACANEASWAWFFGKITVRQRSFVRCAHISLMQLLRAFACQSDQNLNL